MHSSHKRHYWNLKVVCVSTEVCVCVSDEVMNSAEQGYYSLFTLENIVSCAYLRKGVGN